MLIRTRMYLRNKRALGIVGVVRLLIIILLLSVIVVVSQKDLKQNP